MSCVRCHLSPVTCHLSLTPTATSTDPPTAYSPTMHSRLVHQDKNHNPPIFQNTKIGQNFPKKGFLVLKFRRYVLWPECLGSGLWQRGQPTAHKRTLQLIDWIGLGADPVKTRRNRPCLQKTLHRLASPLSHNIRSLALTVCDLCYFEYLEVKDQWINEWINEWRRSL